MYCTAACLKLAASSVPEVDLDNSVFKILSIQSLLHF
jgi:hypothetical protein